MHQPDCIFTVLTSVPANHEVQPFVNRMASTFPNSQILMTGYQVVGQDITTPDNTGIINQINELMHISAN
jgi:hypothetical protein